MSGLVEAGMWKGVGDATSTIGNFMMQNAAREEDRKFRADERMALQQERLDARKETTSAAQSSKGPFMTGIEEGSMAEERAAAEMNMSIPEFRKFRAAQKTGDTSGYEETMTYKEGLSPEDTDPRMRSETKTRSIKPAGFDKWMEDKRRVLAEIQSGMLFGDKYDDMVKGRRGQQEVDASRDAIADPSKAGIIGQGMAAGAGKPLNSQGVNSFTGEANEVGDSVINKNERPPAAKGGGKAGDPYDKSAAKLVDSARQEVAGIRKAISKLEEGFSTPERQTKIDAANKELAAATERLRAAESRLAGKGASGDNSNVKPAGVDPARAGLFKVIR